MLYVKLSEVAKLTLQFMKDNGVYARYYNNFRTDRKKKGYLYTKDGFLKFLRDRVAGYGWDRYGGATLGRYFIIEVLVQMNEIHILLGHPPTYSDMGFFYEMMELYFRERGYYGAKILTDG